MNIVNYSESGYSARLVLIVCVLYFYDSRETGRQRRLKHTWYTIPSGERGQVGCGGERWLVNKLNNG